MLVDEAEGRNIARMLVLLMQAKISKPTCFSEEMHFTCHLGMLSPTRQIHSSCRYQLNCINFIIFFQFINWEALGGTSYTNQATLHQHTVKEKGEFQIIHRKCFWTLIFLHVCAHIQRCQRLWLSHCIYNFWPLPNAIQETPKSMLFCSARIKHQTNKFHLFTLKVGKILLP